MESVDERQADVVDGQLYDVPDAQILVARLAQELDVGWIDNMSRQLMELYSSLLNLNDDDATEDATHANE